MNNHLNNDLLVDELEQLEEVLDEEQGIYDDNDYGQNPAAEYLANYADVNYDTNRAQRFASPIHVYQAEVEEDYDDYQQEYFVSDGLKGLEFGSPKLEIVIEEDDMQPLRTQSQDEDYELTETPYSSQQVISETKPFLVSPEKSYESVPQQSAYRSYMSDFNPMSDVHKSWQDTIQEESFEDELISSCGSFKIRSALTRDPREELPSNNDKNKKISISNRKLPTKLK